MVATKKPNIERIAYTIEEVAEMLGGQSVRSVYNWEHEDGLRVLRIPRRRPLILKTDLEDFLARHSKLVPPEPDERPPPLV
jgi:excisionase family DNA binding protein